MQRYPSTFLSDDKRIAELDNWLLHDITQKFYTHTAHTLGTSPRKNFSPTLFLSWDVEHQIRIWKIPLDHTNCSYILSPISQQENIQMQRFWLSLLRSYESLFLCMAQQHKQKTTVFKIPSMSQELNKKACFVTKYCNFWILYAITTKGNRYS